MKCGSILFEQVEAEPVNSKFKVNFVQCASCGGVIGVLDYYNIGGVLNTLAKKLGVGDIT